jgi:hypothetical protein
VSTYAYVDTILPACAVNFKMGSPDAYEVNAFIDEHRSLCGVETMRAGSAGGLHEGLPATGIR